MRAMLMRYLDGIQCHNPVYKLPTLYVFSLSLMLSFAAFVPAVVHYVSWLVAFVLSIVLAVGDV